MNNPVTLFWFRRDLRLEDNAALYYALQEEPAVIPLFIFDTDILKELDKKDARVEFIHCQLQNLRKKLAQHKSTLLIKQGTPEAVFRNLFTQYNVHAVYTNHDYEPYARKRDQKVEQALQKQNIPFYTFKDQVIFEKEEVVKPDGNPYTVFTPYSKRWLERLNKKGIPTCPSELYLENLVETPEAPLPSLNELGFEKTAIPFPEKTVHPDTLKNYDQKRDFPAENGTSKLSTHLRFGTISIRKLMKEAQKVNPVYLKELIWREFFMMILWHFPKVVDRNFKPQYDHIPWRNNKQEFKRWCEGKTGYPIVDAGMRELNATGYMHNRVRMITASFLCKHLLIDWRWGEAYFAKKLLDYELASNNGNWQWAAGTGCDAAPYFRVFNPSLQEKKFDPKGKYVKKWVPEITTTDYPKPIVDHKLARERAINTYKMALGK